MRALVLALALLAGLKVWYQNSVFRDAADTALSAAYRQQAASACQRLKSPVAVDWASVSALHLQAGNSTIPVRFWQVDHALWSARFKNPYLVLDASAAGQPLACTYDVTLGVAELSRS